MEILRRQITIAHDDVVAIRDDLDRARRFVFKSHSARLLEIEFSHRPATVWTDLHEIAGEALQGGEIIAGSINEVALRSIVRNRFGGTYGNRATGGVSWYWRYRASRRVAALRDRLSEVGHWPLRLADPLTGSPVKLRSARRIYDLRGSRRREVR
jgi:hypothetical protein